MSTKLIRCRRTALCGAVALLTLATPTFAQTTLLSIDSQQGDFVGEGTIHTFTQFDGFVAGRNARNGVSFAVGSAPSWTLDFAAPANALLVPGAYEAAAKYGNAIFAGMNAATGTRSCVALTGRFVVLEAEYAADGSVQRFAVDLEQHCDDAIPALFAALRYNSTITSTVPFAGGYPRYQLSIVPSANGVVTGDALVCGNGLSVCAITLPTAAPVALTATPNPGYVFTGWTGGCVGVATTTVNVNGIKQCAATFDTEMPSVPRTLMVWDSTPGDKIGQGIDDVYSPANSAWTVTSPGDGTSIRIQVARAVRTWTIDIGAPTGEILAPGEYAQVSHFAYPHVGLLDIERPLGFCFGVSTGRVTVLELETAPDGTILRFAADIEQRCDDPLPALVAAIRYNSTIADIRPFGGDYPRYELSVVTPAHGSISGSDITCGGGLSTCDITFPTPKGVTLTATADLGYLFTGWTGACTGGATTLMYVNTVKRCEATFEPLSPAAPRTLLFLDSIPGDFVANGKQRVYSPDAGTFTLTRNALNGIDVSMRARDAVWSFSFSAPGAVALAPGTYAPATRYPFTPFVGMSATSSGACNQLSGRFIVLEAAYLPDGTIQRFAVDLEQHCEDSTPALFASIRYNSALPAAPFGGDYPRYTLTVTIPAHGTVKGEELECGGISQSCDREFASATSVTLDAIPDAGYIFTGWTGACNGGATTTVNVNTVKTCGATFDLPLAASPRALLLVESEPGDPIGQGKAHVFSSSNSIWTATATPDFEGVDVTIDSIGDRDHSPWVLRFRTPQGLPFGPGSYTSAKSPDATKGGLDVMADGSSCNAAIGEFTVHEVIRNPSTKSVSALAVDFEQHCTPYAAPRLTGTLRLNSTVDLPVREVTLLVDQFLPIRFNKPIRWTAAAHPALPVEYRFWRFDASTGWMEVQPYGPNPTYTWTPAYADVGVHSLQVWARRIGSSAEYEAWESTTFSTSIGEPVRFVVFRGSSPSPMVAGSPITWTAEAIGGKGPIYQFWSLDADGWHIVQGYSTSGTYTWTPTAADAGSHAIQVWARSIDVTAPYEAYTGATFEISAPNPVAVSSLTTTSALPALVGQPITWRATANGGVPPVQYQFWRLDAGAWRLVQDYGPSSTYTWTPGAADIGQHVLQVWVRSAGSSAPYESWLGTSFTIGPPVIEIEYFSYYPSLNAGTAITWTAAAFGGVAPLQYQFWRLDADGWHLVQDYSTVRSYTWTPALADVGPHSIQVWIRNAGSTAPYDVWRGASFVIIGP